MSQPLRKNWLCMLKQTTKRVLYLVENGLEVPAWRNQLEAMTLGSPRNVIVRLRKTEPWGTIFKGQASRSHGKKTRSGRARISGLGLILRDRTCGRHS